MSESELDIVSEQEALEEELLSKSAARDKIVKIVNSINADEINISDWENPRIIKPMPKQEEFILADQDIVFYGG